MVGVAPAGVLYTKYYEGLGVVQGAHVYADIFVLRSVAIRV